MPSRTLGMAALALLSFASLAAPARAHPQVVAAYPTVSYYQAPAVVSYYAAPAPVVSYYTAPAVVSYYTAPAVTYYAAPAPVVSYYAAPAVTYATTYRYGAILPRRRATVTTYYTAPFYP